MLHPDKTKNSVSKESDLVTVELDHSTGSRSEPNVGEHLPNPTIRDRMYHIFGPVSPVGGCETWGTVAKSWLFPDIVLVCWRLIALPGLLSAYMYGVISRREELLSFSVDVYTMVGTVFALLLLPFLQACVGDMQDDLNGLGVRWLWTVISLVFQSVLTFVMNITVIFILLVRVYKFEYRAPSFWDVVPLGFLFIELFLGRVRMRMSYAIFATAALSVYVVIVIEGLTIGVGPWLRHFLLAKDGSIVLCSLVGILVSHFAMGAMFVALEKARRRLEELTIHPYQK